MNELGSSLSILLILSCLSFLTGAIEGEAGGTRKESYFAPSLSHFYLTLELNDWIEKERKMTGCWVGHALLHPVFFEKNILSPFSWTCCLQLVVRFTIPPDDDLGWSVFFLHGQKRKREVISFGPSNSLFFFVSRSHVQLLLVTFSFCLDMKTSNFWTRPRKLS